MHHTRDSKKRLERILGSIAMGKGKKKAKGKKNRDGKKSSDDAVGEGHFIAQGLTPEQK